MERPAGSKTARASAMGDRGGAVVQIIFLNGTSSAGKTTVARALQGELAAVWLHVTLDAIFGLMPAKVFVNPQWGDQMDWDRVLDGFHRMVAALPRTGYPVILDHVCTSRRWRDQCVRLFAPWRVLYVGVTCAPDVLERRERGRGDRKLGIAAEHAQTYAAAGPFDVEVDTSRLTAEQCAGKIVAAAEAWTAPAAFDRIRAEMDADAGGDGG